MATPKETTMGVPLTCRTNLGIRDLKRFEVTVIEIWGHLRDEPWKGVGEHENTNYNFLIQRVDVRKLHVRLQILLAD